MKSPPFFYIDDIIFFCVKDNILRAFGKRGVRLSIKMEGVWLCAGACGCGGGVEEKKMACKEKKDMIAY